MSSTTIPILTATSIPKKRTRTPTSPGRPRGSSKYPFASLAVSEGDNCPYFQFEAKSNVSAVALAVRGAKVVPGAKFVARALLNEDGTQKVAESGKPLFGCWRVK